jgi:hypothetical protein
MNKPRYTIEVWGHGVLLCGEDSCSVPIDAITAAAKLVPKEAVIDGGIAHHMREYHEKRNVVMCLGDLVEVTKWREEIEGDMLQRPMGGLPPWMRWWYGTNVGGSSATIAGVLGQFRPALDLGRGNTPKDAHDFLRCEMLLKVMPEWREKLCLVAEKYPAWGPVVARWAELEQAHPGLRNAILDECNKPAARGAAGTRPEGW